MTPETIREITLEIFRSDEKNKLNFFKEKYPEFAGKYKGLMMAATSRESKENDIEYMLDLYISKEKGEITVDDMKLRFQEHMLRTHYPHMILN